LRNNRVLKHDFEERIERTRRRGRKHRQLQDDLKKKTRSPSHWKRLWTCHKTESKTDVGETLRKSIIINTVISPENRAAGLSYLPTAIFRRGKMIKFQSNTNHIFDDIHRIHVSDELTNPSSALNTRQTAGKCSDIST
jgi:hypothetical protein